MAQGVFPFPFSMQVEGEPPFIKKKIRRKENPFITTVEKPNFLHMCTGCKGRKLKHIRSLYLYTSKSSVQFPFLDLGLDPTSLSTFLNILSYCNKKN